MSNKNLVEWLPQIIKIAAFDFKIVLWTYDKANSHNCYGRLSVNEKTISIDETLDRYQMLNTLIHEINHAIYWAYNIQDKDKEERIVTTFATAWTQIYRDNIDLLKFIEKARK